MKSTIEPENEVRWPPRILTLADAVKYIDAVSCCTLFPVNNVALPSLYYAVTRRGPNDPFVWDKWTGMVWRWKDELPHRRRAFYGKFFRGRGTFISLKALPHFLAMRESAAEPTDYDRFYSDGRIRDDARILWEALAEHGPMATLELRHACKMETTAGNVRFKRAILDLQCLLVVVRFGAEQETAAWKSGRYELTCRVFPKETALARDITPEQARAKLSAQIAAVRPDVQPAHFARLFGWSKDQAAAAHRAARDETPHLKSAVRRSKRRRRQ